MTNLLLRAQKPAWWRENAHVVLKEGPDGGIITDALDAARGLAPGETLAVHASFQPVLLYRLLEARGFVHWSQPQDGGRWRVDFYLAPRPGASL